VLPAFFVTAVKVYTYLTPAYNGTARDPDISSFQTDFPFDTGTYNCSIPQCTVHITGHFHPPQWSNTATVLFYLIFFSAFRFLDIFFQQFYALTCLPPFCLSNGSFRSDLSIKALYFSHHSHMPWVPAIPLSLIWLRK